MIVLILHSFLLSFQSGMCPCVWSLCSDTPLWSSAALMTAIMIIMGFGGSPSFSYEDPIVPTNCVEASRTTVCGVEAVGSKEEYVIRALGITELPWQRLNHASGLPRMLEEFRGPSNTGEGSWLNLNPLGSLPSSLAVGGVVNKSYLFQSKR